MVVIHTTRNPYDTVASLVKRGMTPLYAAGIWLYNTAKAIESANSNRYLLVKYERLVEEPEDCIKSICDFIGVDFNGSMLNPSKHDEVAAPGLVTWSANPRKPIKKINQGDTFTKLSHRQQSEIRTVLSSIRLNNKHGNHDNKEKMISVESLCSYLGYQFEPGYESYSYYRQKLQLAYEWLFRTVRGYPTGYKNLPIKLSHLTD